MNNVLQDMLVEYVLAVKSSDKHAEEKSENIKKALQAVAERDHAVREIERLKERVAQREARIETQECYIEQLQQEQKELARQYEEMLELERQYQYDSKERIAQMLDEQIAKKKKQLDLLKAEAMYQEIMCYPLSNGNVAIQDRSTIKFDSRDENMEPITSCESGQV